MILLDSHIRGNQCAHLYSLCCAVYMKIREKIGPWVLSSLAEHAQNNGQGWVGGGGVREVVSTDRKSFAMYD